HPKYRPETSSRNAKMQTCAFCYRQTALFRTSELIAPCRCTSSDGKSRVWIHRHCLAQKRAHPSEFKQCEKCSFTYLIEPIYLKSYVYALLCECANMLAWFITWGLVC